MDISIDQFLTNNPAILTTVILAAVLVFVGLAFELGWHLYKRMNSDSYLNDYINEGAGKVGFSYSGKSSESDNKIELDEVKNELRSMKTSIAQMAEVLKSIYDNTRK